MGDRSSNLVIKRLDRIGEGRIEINGEVIVIEHKKDISAKLKRIYKRGCLDIHTPETLNPKTILVKSKSLD